LIVSRPLRVSTHTVTIPRSGNDHHRRWHRRPIARRSPCRCRFRRWHKRQTFRGVIESNDGGLSIRGRAAMPYQRVGCRLTATAGAPDSGTLPTEPKIR
jgi:hypothetical protein